MPAAGRARGRGITSGIDAVCRIPAECGNVPALLVAGDIGVDRLREVTASGLPRRGKPLTQALAADLQLGGFGALRRGPVKPFAQDSAAETPA
jgi:hypothetical protein